MSFSKWLLPLLLLLSCPSWAAFRSAGTATAAGNTTTLVPGSPSGFVANDILILVVSSDNATPTFSASGFTQLYHDSLTMDGQTTWVAWKRAVGSDSLTVTRAVNTSGSWVGQCFAWSGRDTTNPPVGSTSATNNTANASPTTITANGVTALASDDLFWISILDVSVASATNTLTPPTGYTGRGTANDGSSLSPMATATKDNVSAGATGTVAGSITHSGTSGWAAYLIRIPVAGGAVAAVCTISLMGAGPC